MRQTRRAKLPRVRAWRPLVARAKHSLKTFEQVGLAESKVKQIKNLMAAAEHRIEQAGRCLLPGEKVPQAEQVCSICETHTRWIAKGQASCEVELGVPVCGVEDQRQFLLRHKVLWAGSDVDVAVPLVAEAQELFPDLGGVQFRARLAQS